MKHVSLSEYNPTECISTNIQGAENIIEAAIKNNVKKVIALSTDKAANPINLYGATKLCSDKLFVAANNLAGKHNTRFSVVRYGNVIRSKGSVIPHYEKILESGATKLPLTDINMTRFIISLEEGVNFVLLALSEMSGGEIFVPKLPSIKILDLITAMAGENNYKIVGIRPGEKLHEVMIPMEESLNCIDMKSYYIIQPMFSWWNTNKLKATILKNGKPVSKTFEYSSINNKDWLNIKKIKQISKTKVNMKTLAIRVSNAHFSGQGHIQRCLLIRRLIKYKVIWFLDERNKAIEKKVNNKDIIIYEKSPNLFDKLSS